MTNAVRGLVTAELGGKTWSLEYTIDALCQLEDLLDLSALDILASVARGNTRLGLTRALIWAALRVHHPEVTVAQAGEMIRHADGKAFVAKVSDAFLQCWPTPDPAQEADGAAAANPPPTDAGGGTGGPSSSSGSSTAAVTPTPIGDKPLEPSS